MDRNILATKDRPSNKKNVVGKRRKNNKEDLKVVYISSPIKVKTSASEFRALVQELTGKDSDIADSHFEDHLHRDFSPTKSVSDRRRDLEEEYFLATLRGSVENDGDSPSCSDHRNLQMEDSFVETMLSSVLFNEYALGYGVNT
ncbi:PREDICTED: sigma factor binding protein 2, chloroplastic-like [Tarenaya hassleriana]|uniref:sigma factor binding protein 2, chloroplastic-like n=1 Tax=Tarenaya hassleriana TaxID=28532 RepID=UPI0008FD7596|nr:PREDICTED: sigma factor binding protein 2, chloroplastic-like [Tarenaya hassleriana]